MASAYYSNTVHIDFASILAMENPGIVSVLNALMASGLEGFLGCPAVIYESELVDFFNNGSVRDGLVVSTVNGVPVEFSEQLFAETFEILVDGLEDLEGKTLSSLLIVMMSSSLIHLFRFLSTVDGDDITADVIITDIALALLVQLFHVSISVHTGLHVIKSVHSRRHVRIAVHNHSNWFDHTYEDLIAKWDAEKKVTTPSDTDEEIEAGRASEPVDRVQTEVSQPEYLVEKSADMENSTADQSVDEFIDADEARSLEDIILSIPADIPLPSADIDLLVNLRAQVIDDVDQFFNSLSFNKLATMNLEGISAKGEQVLLWGETENIHVALARKKYILLKYRAVLVRKFLDGWIINFVPGEGDSAVHLKVIDMLSARLSFVLDDLKQQALANGIRWDRPCCSILFDDRLPDQRTTPAYAILEVSSQRQYDDTLPLMGEFFRLMKKRWADVCLEVVGFCNSRRLLQVGSLQFCRSLSVVELVFRVAPRQSPVSALRVSQFCSVFIDFSLFSWLPTTDITDFLSSIALDRTIFRDVQIAQNIVSVAPSVQMLDEPSSSDSSSDDILMDFADQDTTAAANSLPAATVDLSSFLDDLKSSLSQRIQTP
ncbi:dystroglycan-like [Dorcoceras hygrometricum]|uniref:Dystroglycan-like n=1 Tax=Dorcoceras hygrometricum TaxID=472368 RepID=A0A2Z7B1Y5_9LAMI|nr:dystroglycan-like [Dorcoceras hygrometricum]